MLCFYQSLDAGCLQKVVALRKEGCFSQVHSEARGAPLSAANRRVPRPRSPPCRESRHLSLKGAM